MLIFAKSVPRRTAMARMFLDSSGRKYSHFESPDELRGALKAALHQCLVLGLRSLAAARRAPLANLRDLADNKSPIRIEPVIPGMADRLFHIESVDRETITLVKHSSHASYQVPIKRISEVLPPDGNQPPAPLLDGRLQWITATQIWCFFPEKPDPTNVLGLFKNVSLNDRRVTNVTAKFRQKGYDLGWAAESEVSARHNWTNELVYDDDGRYFRVPDPVRSLALIVRPRQSG
jgi:hypothetical protein